MTDEIEADGRRALNEIRELKFRLKQLGKQNGRQGETIHQLRAELAEAQQINDKISRGELRSLERQLVNERRRSARLVETYDIVFSANQELREKLAVVESIGEFANKAFEPDETAL